MFSQKKQNTFQVYTASAGSGKTFRLTLEYLKIALSNPSEKFKNILAITFTVKATNEMKARILEACKAFSDLNIQPVKGRNKALFEQLKKETGWTKEEITSRSQVLFKKIIHNYSDFAISTIDSFSQRLIRAFAFELNLPLQFEVIIDQSATIDYLQSELLQLVGQDKAFTSFMLSFFRAKLNEDDSIYIEKDIEDAIKVLFKDESMLPLEHLSNMSTEEFETIYQKLLKKITQLEKEIKKICTLAIQAADEQGYEINNFIYKSDSAFSSFQKIAENIDYELQKRFRSTVAQKTKWLSSDYDDIYLESTLTHYGKQLLILKQRYVLFTLFRKNYPKIALLAKIKQLYNQHKKEEEILLISEFNRTINKEVRGQPAPFIYEKVGEYYDHVLLDEFQDTSVMQWHNLVPMVAEVLSKENHPKSLVVGDSKQAIYRFRGGETKQLTALPNLLGAQDDSILKEQENVLAQYYEQINLAFNYRSRETVVGFNNQLYRWVEGHPELKAFKDIYGTYYQKAATTGNGGFVSVQFYNKEKGEKTAPFKERRAALFVEQVKDASERGFPYRKMAVLCRKNKDLRLVAQHLQAAGIPIVSKDSLALNQEKYISVFPAIVEWFVMPDNQILQTKIANTFQEVGILKASKHELNYAIGQKNMTSITEFSDFISAYNSNIQLNLLNKTDLLSLFENYCSWLPENYQQSAFLSFFRDELWKLIQKEGNNLEAFLEWWKENEDELYLKSSEEADGVNLLTIHKAKGLEFEVVFLPFADWKITQNSFHQENRWLQTNSLDEKIEFVYLPMNKVLQNTEFAHEYEQYQKDNLLDHLNLLYVATTRAISELHIYSERPKKSGSLSNPSTMSYFWDLFFDQKNVSLHTFGQPVIYENQGQPIKKQCLEIDKTAKEFGQADTVVKNRAQVIWNEEIRGKIDFGELVHQLLAEIKLKSDIDSVLEQSVAQGLLPLSQLPQVKIMIEQVVFNQSIEDFFTDQNEILTEQPIITPEGKEYIPDRIAKLSPQEVKILDFKTGQHETKHKKQINLYSSLLEQMGMRVISRQLVYLQPFDIITC